MSLMQMLLSEPGAADKYAQVLAMQQGTHDPRASADMGSFTSGGDNPWGIDPNGMNLVTRHGTTFDSDAMRSLVQASRATGIPVWKYIGGSIRSEAQSAAMLNSGNGLPHAPPGYSMHNYGLAFDQSRELPGLLQRYLQNNGWYNGASWGDPPHWSYGRNG